MWSIFLFDSLSVFYQNIQSELQQQRGWGAVAMATKAAAIVITRLLLHCVCVCLRVCVWTQRVWVHPPLFRQEARTSPSNTVPERKRERARAEREPDWNPIMHRTLQGWSRADSSVPVRGVVCERTRTHTPRPKQENTRTSRQVRQLCSDRTDSAEFFEIVCFSVRPCQVRREEWLYTDARVWLIFDMLWSRQLLCLLLVTAAKFCLKKTWNLDYSRGRVY